LKRNIGFSVVRGRLRGGPSFWPVKDIFSIKFDLSILKKDIVFTYHFRISVMLPLVLKILDLFLE